MSNFDGVAKHSFYLSLLILRKQVHFPGRQKPGASRLPGLPLPARNEDISGENLLFLVRYPRGSWAMEPGGAKVPAAPGELQVSPASAAAPQSTAVAWGRVGTSPDTLSGPFANPRAHMSCCTSSCKQRACMRGLGWRAVLAKCSTIT